MVSRGVLRHTMIATIPIVEEGYCARWTACLWRNRFEVTDLLKLWFYKRDELHLVGISTILDHQVKLIEEITQPAVAVLTILLIKVGGHIC